MESGRSGVQTEATIGIDKMGKNDVEKIMLRGDHRVGLVVLIPKL